MTKIIFDQKNDLIAFGNGGRIIFILDLLKKHFGFNCILKRDKSNLMEFVNINAVYGILVFDDKAFVKEILKMGRVPIFLNSKEKPEKLIKNLEKYLYPGIPNQLKKVIQAAIKVTLKSVLEIDFLPFAEEHEYSHSFGFWVICDSIGKGIILKATCEMDLKTMGVSYPELKEKGERLLIDAAGEICNQILGLINNSLNQVSLFPLISVPVKIQSNGRMGLSEIGTFPYLRMIDAEKKFAITVFAQIDPSYQIDWGLLSDRLNMDVAVEFF